MTTEKFGIDDVPSAHVVDPGPWQVTAEEDYAALGSVETFAGAPRKELGWSVEGDRRFNLMAIASFVCRGSLSSWSWFSRP